MDEIKARLVGLLEIAHQLDMDARLGRLDLAADSAASLAARVAEVQTAICRVRVEELEREGVRLATLAGVTDA